VWLTFTSGTATSTAYTVVSVTATTFTVTAGSSATTSGNVEIYLNGTNPNEATYAQSSSTTVTFTRNAHGLAVGDPIYIHNILTASGTWPGDGIILFKVQPQTPLQLPQQQGLQPAQPSYQQ